MFDVQFCSGKQLHVQAITVLVSLTIIMYAQIASQCLIPLARQHASLDLARRARGERHGAGTLLELDRTSSGGASKWRPPQLTQLAGVQWIQTQPPQ